MILKSRLTNSQPQVYTGVAHLRGQERWRTGSGDSHTRWVGLERQLPPTSGPRGGGVQPAKFRGTIASLKHPAAGTPGPRHGRLSVGAGGPSATPAPRASARPVRGTKLRNSKEKSFPRKRRAARSASRASGSARPGPGYSGKPPRPDAPQGGGRQERAPSPGTPRPERTLGPAGAPRAPRGKVRRVTCGERGERGTTPEAPSRRPPLCLPPVRLPGGNGPPCAPAPGPPRAAPACPSRHLPPLALPDASRGLQAARPGLAQPVLSGVGCPATLSQDPQKASYGLGARRAGPPTGRRGGDSGNSPRPGKAGGGQVSHGSQLR